MLCIVAAYAENYVIGMNNRLPWNLPNDLKRFKEITLTQSRTVIMGRKTFETLPFLLPGRKHIVLTSNKNLFYDASNTCVINHIRQLEYQMTAAEEFFVIGGDEIFSLLLPFTQKMYLTLIHSTFEGDAYFPKFDKADWKVVYEEKQQVDHQNHYLHTFYTYHRIIDAPPLKSNNIIT